MSVFQGFCLLFLRTCVFFQLLSLSVILCFNLETRLPITKFGHNGSYFGFSVASHQSLEEQEYERNRFPSTNKNYWMLIGAPLDKNIQPNTYKSGALWKCPLTTKINDCDQVVTDGKRNSSTNNLPVYDPAIDDDHLLAPLPDEIKEDQWLGVSVRSQEPMGKVIVCAHRYVRIERTAQSKIGGVDNSPRYARGLCYILAQNLTYDSQYHPCQGQGNVRTDFAFGYCQTGVSSMMLDDWAIMGSPGNDNWAGNLFVANVVDDLKEKSSTVYHSPYAPQGVGMPEKYGLLGMSVSGGKYFKDDEMSYAAGAPRSNNTGQVYLFKKNLGSRDSDPGVMSIQLVLNGEQIGSSFGYELATADVNGDKKPDLIVGAPFYFEQDIGGAVYVYYNTPPTGLNNQNKLMITGKPESRFGIAISNLGDLNKDGYEDIAVGAPYQGNGVVYIYLGSKKGLNPEPSQIITAESIPNPSPTSRPLVTWGSSLSPGVDMDDNGYPDLLVGAYESGIAVLLRARPIIQLETSLKPDFNLKNIDPSKTGCQADINAEYTCFTFEACCKILSLNQSSWKVPRSKRNGKLILRYKLEAETFVPATKFSRVFFGPDKTARLHILEKEFEMKGDESCQTHTVYVKENTKDIQSPIRMKLSYSLVQSDPRLPRPGEPLPSMDDHPILDQTAADRTFEATFHTDCGDNEVCECELRVEAELQLEAKHGGGGYYELLLGQHQEVTLNISTSNQGESAYEAQLFVSHHTHLSYIGQEKQRGAVCNPFNATLVVCSLGNPFKTGAWSNLKLRFDPTGLGEEPELKFLVWANSTSKEINKEDPVQLIVNIVRKAELSLTGFHRPEHIYYGGVLSPKPPVYLDEVGTRLVHTYQVFNAGPWRLSALDIHVEWPYQVTGDEEGKEGKPLLYLESEPIVDGLGGGKCTVMGSINQYELHQKPGSLELDPFSKQHSSTRVKRESVRVKREISKYTVIPETYTDQEGKKHKIVKMNCTSGTARCFQIICSVYNLQANHEATIAIRARLWNATLVEDYPHVDRVYITSRAKIHIPPSLFLQQMNHTDDQTEVVTVAMKDLVTQSRPLWHIILIAILLGLFLLILLILCLRRLGFFHRRRRPDADDPTLSGNLRAADIDDDDDEDYRAALKQHPY